MHSVLRPVHGLFEEFFETFLHIDGRILHTLPPLLLKPGFLSLEYFSGRRVRYIAPFRLMFVLCLLSFFVLHLATDVIANRAEQRQQQRCCSTTAPIFHRRKRPNRSRTRWTASSTRWTPRVCWATPRVVTQTDAVERKLREQANSRLLELGAPPASTSHRAWQPQ